MGKVLALLGGGLLLAVWRRRKPADDPWRRAAQAQHDHPDPGSGQV
jgi:hypothetical protein